MCTIDIEDIYTKCVVKTMIKVAKRINNPTQKKDEQQ